MHLVFDVSTATNYFDDIKVKYDSITIHLGLLVAIGTNMLCQAWLCQL